MVVFVITGGIGTSVSAIGSEGRCELWQLAGIALHLNFGSV